MRVAAVHFFVENDAVETFARRVGDQFFRQGDVFLAGKAEAVNDFADLVFRGLDALGNFHLLLARQQRHLPHLLEIHPHRVVQDVQPRRVVLLGVGLLDAVHFRLVHDLDFQRAQFGKNLVQLLRRDTVFRQRVVDVVVGQMALLLGEADEFLDFFRQLRVRTVVQSRDGDFLRGELAVEVVATRLPVCGMNLPRLCEPSILTYDSIFRRETESVRKYEKPFRLRQAAKRQFIFCGAM